MNETFCKNDWETCAFCLEADSRKMELPGILIVDDEKTIREALVRMLEGEFHIYQAGDGREVLPLLQKAGEGISLVLLVINTPELNGLDVLLAMEDDGWLENIPVIVVSAKTEPAFMTRAYELGVLDLIQMPFCHCQVRQKANNAIQMYAWKRENEFLQQISAAFGEMRFLYSQERQRLEFNDQGARHLGLKRLLEFPEDRDCLEQVVANEDVFAFLRQLQTTAPTSAETLSVANDLVEGDGQLVKFCCLVAIGGEQRWHQIIARPLWSAPPDSRWLGAVGKIEDVHYEQEHLLRLELMASHDMMTGLLNQYSAEERIAALLDAIPRRRYALMLLDLDHFKQINDRCGHLYGNRILKLVAEKMLQCIGPNDLAARVGGDEFLIFVECEEDVEAQAERVFQTVTGVQRDILLHFSMGVACTATGDERSYELLFSQADQALYAAKEAGRKTWKMYR